MNLHQRALPSIYPFSYKNRAATQLLAQHLESKMMHIFDSSGKKQNIDALLKSDPEKWNTALSNEIGRLAQGIGDVKGNNAVDFIPISQVPTNKKVAYAIMICDHRPLKTEVYRVRLTIGGDVLDFFGDASSPAASLLEAKLLINSVISNAHKGARFMSLDIKDHFLQSMLEEPEYLRIHGK